MTVFETEKSSKELTVDRENRLALIRKASFDAPPAQRQLPLWQEFFRGLPNEIARSSLFSSRNRATQRIWHKGESLFVLGDAEVLYRGEELRQLDEVVWLQVLHLARLQPLQEWVEFVPLAMLKAIGWTTGKKDYDRLKSTLSRLQATSLQLQSKRLKSGVSLSLVRKFEWKDRKQWRVMLEPEMQLLFPDDYYSRVMWTQRLKLPSGIASKLHSYFASHRLPLPVKIANLKELCGSTAGNFKPKLEAALETLVESGFLLNWRIDENNLVFVTRA